MLAEIRKDRELTAREAKREKEALVSELEKDKANELAELKSQIIETVSAEMAKDREEFKMERERRAR